MHPLNKQFAFTTSKGYKIVCCEDILYCIATGGYTEVYLVDATSILVTKNLGSLEEKLPSEIFLRIHHGFLVNRLQVVELLVNGKCSLLMSNGKELEVATRRKSEVLNCFERI